jgi:phosphatidylglycerol:prolipoprotein diacylglycerol transferase
VALAGIPTGVVFARLLHVVDNIVVARAHPELAFTGVVFDYTQDPGRILGAGGLTAYGAVLGASLGIWLYCRAAQIPAGSFFHMFAPAVILSLAIGRVGCILNGCCWGVACSLPWGIQYTSPASGGFGAGVIHPTQLYEIMFNVAAFGVLLKLRDRVRPDGSLFLVFLGLYSVYRVSMDFLRPGTPFLFGLHQAQVIGIVVLAISLPLLIRRAPWSWTGRTQPLPQNLEVS